MRDMKKQTYKLGSKELREHIIMLTSINYVMLTGELAGLIVTGVGYLLTRGVEMMVVK